MNDIFPDYDGGDSDRPHRWLDIFNIKPTSKGLTPKDILGNNIDSNETCKRFNITEKTFSTKPVPSKRNNIESVDPYFYNKYLISKKDTSIVLTPYTSKKEDDYYTQDEFLTIYNKTEVEKLVKILKSAPKEQWYSFPTHTAFDYLKKDIHPEMIEHMFQSCLNNEATSGEPTEKQKGVYKNIFNVFSDLFGDSNDNNEVTNDNKKLIIWTITLNKCLRHVLQMKRYNMWLLKLLFKEGVGVNIDNYTFLLKQQPSSAVLKFVEKHLVDELDNTISVGEMKRKIESRNKIDSMIEDKNKSECEVKVKNEDKVEKKDEIKFKNEDKKRNENEITDSKVCLNLRWTGGSFKVNLKNAHTSIIEEKNGNILLDIQLE